MTKKTKRIYKLRKTKQKNSESKENKKILTLIDIDDTKALYRVPQQTLVGKQVRTTKLQITFLGIGTGTHL